MKVKYRNILYAIIGCATLIFAGYALSGVAQDSIRTMEQAYPGFSTSILRGAELHKMDKGKEVFRHVGFFAENDVLKQLPELRVK